MLLKDRVEKGFGGEAEVGAEDEIDAGDGSAKVFRHEVGGDGREEGSVNVGECRGRIFQRFIVPEVCYKSRIFIIDEVFETRCHDLFQRFQSDFMFCRGFYNNAFIINTRNKLVNIVNNFVNIVLRYRIYLIDQENEGLH